MQVPGTDRLWAQHSSEGGFRLVEQQPVIQDLAALAGEYLYDRPGGPGLHKRVELAQDENLRTVHL